MEIFVHQQNLLFLRGQLAETPDEVRLLLLLKLLAEEEAKNQHPPLEKQAASVGGLIRHCDSSWNQREPGKI